MIRGGGTPGQWRLTAIAISREEIAIPDRRYGMNSGLKLQDRLMMDPDFSIYDRSQFNLEGAAALLHTPDRRYLFQLRDDIPFLPRIDRI